MLRSDKNRGKVTEGGKLGGEVKDLKITYVRYGIRRKKKQLKLNPVIFASEGDRNLHLPSRGK